MYLGNRSLHEKLSSPDRKRCISPRWDIYGYSYIVSIIIRIYSAIRLMCCNYVTYHTIITYDSIHSITIIYHSYLTIISILWSEKHYVVIKKDYLMLKLIVWRQWQAGYVHSWFACINICVFNRIVGVDYDTDMIMLIIYYLHIYRSFNRLSSFTFIHLLSIGYLSCIMTYPFVYLPNHSSIIIYIRCKKQW